MTCQICNKTFLPGNRPDGIPNGVAFIKKDGTKITICAECIIKKGEEQHAEN